MPSRISLELLMKYNLIDNVPENLKNKKLTASRITINGIEYKICLRCTEHHKHHAFYPCPELKVVSNE